MNAELPELSDELAASLLAAVDCAAATSDGEDENLRAKSDAMGVTSDSASSNSSRGRGRRPRSANQRKYSKKLVRSLSLSLSLLLSMHVAQLTWLSLVNHRPGAATRTGGPGGSAGSAGRDAGHDRRAARGRGCCSRIFARPDGGEGNAKDPS